MTIAMFDPAVLGLLGIVLGGGFIGGIAAFRKAGSESSAIGIKSLIEVNQELRREVKYLRGEIAELRAELHKHKLA